MLKLILAVYNFIAILIKRGSLIWIILFGLYALDVWKQIEANKIKTQIDVEEHRTSGAWG
jgi:hypothetical protein